MALNTTIAESGYETLMDLPCGYTPKVFDFVDRGMNYIGCDLPAVIDGFEPVIESMADEEQKKKIQFSVVDVTNFESMKAAADKAKGPVCISTEGLTVYLNEDEKVQLRQNIRKILAEKGGCWLNVDIETLEYYMAVFKAVVQEKAGELMLAARRGFGGQSDTNFEQNNASIRTEKSEAGIHKIDYEKIEALYKRDGLLVEKIPYYRDDLTLHLFDKMSPEEIERLKENSKYVNIWKITADSAFSEKNDRKEEDENISDLPFAVNTDVSDGSLSMTIQGRMDTITAPEVLKKFRNAGDVKEIHVDVSRMSYISSAGLRVLLMMYKSIADKDKFEMAGITDSVRDILETTGFDQFFN